jgi:hypothetical protein
MSVLLPYRPGGLTRKRHRMCRGGLNQKEVYLSTLEALAYVYLCFAMVIELNKFCDAIRLKS